MGRKAHAAVALRAPRFRLDLRDVSLAMQCFDDSPFVAISQSQRAPLPELNWLATIHHGMPAELLELSERPETYLAFLTGSRQTKVRMSRSGWHAPQSCHCALPPRCRAGKIAISTKRSGRSSMATMASLGCAQPQPGRYSIAAAEAASPRPRQCHANATTRDARRQ
jgi:hypothetical protein